MRISSVQFGFTKNLGHYQSMRVGVEIEVTEEDDPRDAMLLAKAYVRHECGIKLKPAHVALLIEHGLLEELEDMEDADA